VRQTRPVSPASTVPVVVRTPSLADTRSRYASSGTAAGTWSAPTQVAGPMNLSWIPNTSQGRMFGDDISTSIRGGGNAVAVIPIGNAPTGSTFDLAMYAPAGGLPLTGGALRASAAGVRSTTGTGHRFSTTR
jgi:hypothetical protein